MPDKGVLYLAIIMKKLFKNQNTCNWLFIYLIYVVYKREMNKP